MTDYRFPVVGFPKGKIPLHWNTSPNAADLFAARGTPVQSMVNGVVEATGIGDQYGGNWVEIKGDPDTKALDYYYAHFDKPPLVSKGQRVTAGQQIGVVGDSGNAAGKGTHLHIGIGRGINDGIGAEGGAGNPWPGNNCNKFLQYILDTIGSGGGGVTPPPPPPPPVNYETVLRVLTAKDGGVLVSLRDRKARALEEANQIQNIINEIERNRPA